MIDQVLNVTAEEYTEHPARISSHLLRNGLAGIGHKNKALRRRPLALACRWSSKACDAKYVQFLNWNAGNLSRNCRGDALNDVLVSPYHCETIQEASTVASQPALFEARGIKPMSSSDGKIMINSGGAGHKMSRQLTVKITNSAIGFSVHRNINWSHRHLTRLPLPSKSSASSCHVKRNKKISFAMVTLLNLRLVLA